MEKDWGKTFPKPYIWVQSNHFNTATCSSPGSCQRVSLFSSVARVPLPSGIPYSFTGFLGGLLIDGHVYQFATHTGAW